MFKSIDVDNDKELRKAFIINHLKNDKYLPIKKNILSADNFNFISGLRVVRTQVDIYYFLD